MIRFFIRKDSGGYYNLIKSKNDIEIKTENYKSDMVDDLFTIYDEAVIDMLIPNAKDFPPGIHEVEVSEELNKAYIRRKILIEFNNSFNQAMINLSEMGLLKEVEYLCVNYTDGDLAILGEWNDGWRDSII